MGADDTLGGDPRTSGGCAGIMVAVLLTAALAVLALLLWVQLRA